MVHDFFFFFENGGVLDEYKRDKAKGCVVANNLVEDSL